jgi:hypothetical protein
LLLNAPDAKSAKYETPQRAFSRDVVEAQRNEEAVPPSFINPPWFDEYKGAIYKLIA